MFSIKLSELMKVAQSNSVKIRTFVSRANHCYKGDKMAILRQGWLLPMVTCETDSLCSSNTFTYQGCYLTRHLISQKKSGANQFDNLKDLQVQLFLIQISDVTI
jgi:hypothetical protein